MRLLFTRFPLESAFGGAEVQTLSLMEGLIARGHSVAFAGSCPVLLEECRARGIPVTECHIGPPPVTGWGALSFTWRQIGMKRKLRHMLAQFNDLDAIAMLSLSEKLLLTDTAAAQNTRVIWIEHDRIGRWLTANPWLGMLRSRSRNAITVPVSALSGRLYEKLGWDPSRIHSIPNGIDERRLLPHQPHSRSPQSQTSSSKLKAESLKLHVGCIARLSPEKGVDVLIRALAGTPEHVTLEIVGTGPEEASLRRLTRSLGLEKRITFTRGDKDVRKVYARFDALILPSRDNDPFGLVAAEAMMLGLPVIVTDACGIAENLKHGEDALVVTAGADDALRDALLQLIDPNVYRTLADHAAQTASEKFSAKRMVEEYELLFTVPVPPAR